MSSPQQFTVETWPIAKISPYEKNARKIPQLAIDKVARSIQEFGFRQPIVVDEAGVIIVGHVRRLAALQLHIETVPVHVARGLTLAQIKAYRLMDNRSHEDAKWDMNLLTLELQELKLEGLALELTGFNEADLAALAGGSAADTNRSLADRFGVPPFSILDARQGYWQDRKRAWLSIGIQSELGRGDGNLLGFSDTVNLAFKGKNPHHERNIEPTPTDRT